MPDFFEIISGEYNAKRRRAEETAKINYERALSDGEFFDAEKKIRRLIIDSAKASLKIKGKNSFDKEIESLEKVKESALFRLKIRTVKPEYECRACNDTGFVNNSPCKCYKLRINELISNRCGLYLPNLNKFDDFNESLFDEKERPSVLKTRDTFVNYCKNFPDNKKLNLIFSGKTGSGKSFIAGCIASGLIERGFSVIFATAFALSNIFLENHVSSFENKTLFLNAINSVDLLIIDDLGCENIYNNVTNEYFLAVLNERSLCSKATIITTNLNAKEIEENYKDRFVSRLLDTKTCRFINFSNKDLRLTAAN